MAGQAFLNTTTVSSFNIVNKEDWTDQPRMVLLLRWARLVCAHYGVPVDNFSTSFSDGRALCYLVHHYHPEFLAAESVMDDTTATYQAEGARPLPSEAGLKKLLRNEKANFSLLHTKVSLLLCYEV